MPQPINTQSPFGQPTPQPVRLPTEVSDQADFNLGAQRQKIETDQQKRENDFNNSQELWKAGKLKDEDFLKNIYTLAQSSFSEDERKNYTTLGQVVSQEVLKNKLDTEFKKIQAKVVNGALTGQGAYNAIVQLGVQAGTGGLENLSADYFLQAATTLQSLKNGGKKGGKLTGSDVFNSFFGK